VKTGATVPAGAPASGSSALIQVSNLRKTYRLGRVDVPVLHGIDLSVRRGEWVAVLGASGSGKSTLLHLLGGLDTPDRPGKKAKGRCPGCGYDTTGLIGTKCPECGRGVGAGGTEASRIVFDGRALGELSSGELNRFRSRSIGFVFQFYHLLPELTVVENVLTAAMVRAGITGYWGQRGAARDRARDLLERFGLGHRLTHRPAQLSGGERQRVALARALVNEPAIVLADEPTGNLDRQTGEKILLVLEGLRERQSQTMVVATHDAEIAARADRVVRLVDGRIVEDQ
jgi:lipoprotein-releasing system ATP-binding protein